MLLGRRRMQCWYRIFDSCSIFTPRVKEKNCAKKIPRKKIPLTRRGLAQDVNMESKPIRTIYVHEQLRSKLCDLYENDAIFDKFQCSFSGDAKWLLTGSYHNYLHIYDRIGKGDVCIEV